MFVGQDRLYVRHDHLGLAYLHIVGCTADMRGEHHIVHFQQRVLDGKRFAVNMVEGRATKLTTLKRTDQRINIMESRSALS